MTDATALITRCQELDAVLIPEGDHLRIRAPKPLPADLMEELRRHKSEILIRLSKPQVVVGPPEWHPQEIARAVEEEGVCVFWSDLFSELVAFIKDDSLRGSVPAGLVAYTSEELVHLFGDGKPKHSPQTLRLIHEAKKQGGHVRAFKAESEIEDLGGDRQHRD